MRQLTPQLLEGYSGAVVGESLAGRIDAAHLEGDAAPGFPLRHACLHACGNRLLDVLAELVAGLTGNPIARDDLGQPTAHRLPGRHSDSRTRRTAAMLRCQARCPVARRRRPDAVSA